MKKYGAVDVVEKSSKKKKHKKDRERRKREKLRDHNHSDHREKDKRGKIKKKHRHRDHFGAVVVEHPPMLEDQSQPNQIAQMLIQGTEIPQIPLPQHRPIKDKGHKKKEESWEIEVDWAEETEDDAQHLDPYEITPMTFDEMGGGAMEAPHPPRKRRRGPSSGRLLVAPPPLPPQLSPTAMSMGYLAMPPLKATRPGREVSFYNLKPVFSLFFRLPSFI